MKKTIFLTFMLFVLALLPQAMAADPITDKVHAIVHYAEQYEMGQISYPELQIYANSLREDIRELMSATVFGLEKDMYYEGVSEESARKYFGKPTETTDWVWIANEEHEERVAMEMPKWEKVVFDGKKIQITFNAWPQIYRGEDGEKKFYWVDFHVRFKKQFDFDLGQMQAELKILTLRYLDIKEGAEELAGKLVQFSNLVHGYVDQNKENCEMMMKKFFSSEDKTEEQEIIMWESVIFTGQNLKLIANTRLCESCEWTWADTWLEPRIEGPGFKDFKQKFDKKGSFDKEELMQKEIPELLKMLKQEFDRARAGAEKYEQTSSGFDLGQISNNIQTIQQAISEQYNWDDRFREENKQAYISALDDILGGYGKNEKTKIKELRYEKRLVEDIVERKQSWCREVQQESCDLDEGCIDGECVFALGGEEDCHNNRDDDGDTLVDCMDPDCARDCGKYCRDVCETGCWPCFDRECRSECSNCNKCQEGGSDIEECKKLCEEECWPCHGKCRSQPACADCNACEEASWQEEGKNCDRECGPCNTCTESKDPAECELECQPCVDCKSPAENPECMGVCERITQGYMGQLEACQQLCKQNVIFYCSGSKQHAPCEDTTYICDGKSQVIPCLIYTCEDRKQTVPCGQEAFCGENQVAAGEQCKCRAGYYDCDKDGKSCETNVPCTGAQEICDDEMDNDDDLLIDCEDMMDCKYGMPCGEGKVCFDGDCISLDDRNITVDCGENAEYVGEECVCMEGFSDWEGECVPTIVPVICPKGFVLVDDICQPANETICLEEGDTFMPGEGECCAGLQAITVSYGDGIFCTLPMGYACTNACGDGVCEGEYENPCSCSEDCLVEEVECEEGYVLVDGECLLVEVGCPEGYILKDGNCELQCPETHELIDGECKLKEDIVLCPEGYILDEENNCILQIEDCPEGFEMTEDGICKEITTGPVEGECLEGFILKDGGCVAIPVECPISHELIDGECKPKEFECGEGYFFEDWKCVKLKKCKAGFVLEDNKCVLDFAVDCPMFYDYINGECIFVGGEVECGEDEVLEAGTCVSKKIFEDHPVRPEETGKQCVLAGDCGSERAICSNGKCKEIPQEIYEQEYGDEGFGEVTVPEEFEETIVRQREVVGEYEEPEEPEEEFGSEYGKEHGEERREEQREEPREEPKEEPREEPREEPPEFTGTFTLFEKLTGKAVGEEKQCETHEDCNENQQCDDVMGRCHCDRGWFDCNGRGDGNDGDGCEADDPTCGGQRELCEGGCNENQYCDEVSGHCECEKGYFNCDGNWMSGCESNIRCMSCASDDGCAAPVCAEWDNVIIKFGCVEDKGWVEHNAMVSFSGGCEFRPTGKVDSYMHFDSWGPGMEEIEEKRRILEYQEMHWCSFELEGLVKERKELQEGLDQDFLIWFFDDYLEAEPEKWENRISGIFDIYWKLVDNTREMARVSQCLDNKEMPSEYSPIEIEYESDFGTVHLWEEEKNVNEFGMKVLSPYMEIWIFPSKEIFKMEIIKAREGGYMPGPPEERMKEMGPSPEEKEQIKRDPRAMEDLEDFLEDFDGRLEALLSLKDDDEDLFNIKIAMNTDVIFKGKPIKVVDFEPDISVEVQMDFLYDMVKSTEEHGELETPPWDWERGKKGFVRNALEKGSIVAKVLGALVTGDIKVRPLSAVPKVLKLIEMMSEGKAPMEELEGRTPTEEYKKEFEDKEK